ncbi:hypothetical protein LCGC14_1048910 [marine sediment metagenome]|uniref:Uncharacterized protein n=1 Tax=marine sediment metagenome TaxID=412755 RepID=A0A0F9Q7G8_9ZZZZ
MGVAKTAKVYIQGVEFLTVVKVSREGKFTMALPEFVAEVIGQDVVEAQTLLEVEQRFHAAVAASAKANTVVKKVILYEVGLQALVQDAEGKVLVDQKMSFIEGIGLSVWAEVVEERETTLPGGEKKYHYDRVGSSLRFPRPRYDTTSGRHEKQMDWTPEREAFFAHIGASMEQLILKLFEVCGTPQSLLDFIDAGHQLTAGGQDA